MLLRNSLRVEGFVVTQRRVATATNVNGSWTGQLLLSQV